MKTKFGIDFGTTNTRIAYFDGTKPIMVPVFDSRGRAYSIPTAVGYRQGKPVVFGHDSLTSGDVTLCKSIKWLVERDEPVAVDGEVRDPIQIAADFFSYLKKVVAESKLKDHVLKEVALTMPVHYPYKARKNLCRACELVGIEVTHILQEPVAALYSYTLAEQSHIAGVFDWGGGTLEVAIAQIEGNRVQIKMVDNLKVGGEDFDRLLVQRALEKFVQDYPEDLISPEELMVYPRIRANLFNLAEQAKVELSKAEKAHISWNELLPKRNLKVIVSRAEFEEWIHSDVERAVSCLKSAIYTTGAAEKLISPILLSGGTSNIPLIQARIRQEFGDYIITRLPYTRHGKEVAPEEDVSNATAIGGALLAFSEAKPVFSVALGVRTAHTTAGEDSFYPVFHKGEAVELNTAKRESFFVTDATTGVARLLVCEQRDPYLQPSGRLLRVITIPIERKEVWVDVEFEPDRYLGMSISGNGRVAPCDKGVTECFIEELKLGFEIPPAYKEIFSGKKPK